MNRTALTLEQAHAISLDYQYIIGSVYDKSQLGKGRIECIAIAPYDEAKQWQFAQYYREFRDPQKSIQFYKGDQYDVLVLSIPLLRKRGIHFLDLRSYVAENDIPFNIHRYPNGKTGNQITNINSTTNR